MLYTRFVVETPALVSISQSVSINDSGKEKARFRSTEHDGFTARVWEADDVAQSLQESSMPGGAEQAGLASVRVEPGYASWADVRDRYREHRRLRAAGGRDL
jgi:hypothetical protein